MPGYNFTDRVRKVLQLAREEAIRLNHEHVGTEHLLLGVLREGGGVAVAVLRELRVDPDDLQQRIKTSLEPGKPHDVGPDLPYTSRAKKVLEFALTETRELGHPFVGSEHLLLGLLHHECTPAVTALATAGVKLADARAVAARLRPPAQAHQARQVFVPTARSAFILALIALVMAVVALLIALTKGSP